MFERARDAGTPVRDSRRFDDFRWRRLASVTLVFFLVACGARDSGPFLTNDEDGAKRLFSVSYEDISNIYIDEVSTHSLAVSGLESLTSIDPALSLMEEGKYLSQLFEGVETKRITMPADDDTEGWGDVTAAFIKNGRFASVDLDQTPAEEIYEAVFDGMLAQLDGFSRYAGRDAARENRASRDGFGGIGVRIRLVEEGVLVLSVMENTPAERGGLLKDDIIVAIDGEAVAGLTQREAVSRLRGAIRSEVRLTIDRPDEVSPVQATLVRAHIIPQTARYSAKGNAAYIQITGFNQNTTRSLRERIEMALEEQGDDLTGFIIDLRNNPGGLLDQSVSVSDLFMQGGRIVTTRGRHPDSHQYFEANNQDVTNGRPIVLLSNAGSASASEIVAAALQDSGRAVVVGSVSFGKGTVQTLLRLPNQGELTLTWARFHAPSGYALNKRGVLPDVCTSAKDATLDEVLEAMRGGRGLADHHLRNLDIPARDEAAVDRVRAACPANEEDADIDIEVATRLLEEPELYAIALQGTPNTAKLQTSNLSQ